MIMPIKFRLKELMKERDVTFKELNQDTGISTGTLYNIRENRQKMIGVDVLGRLLDFFDCNPNELIVRTSDQQN